MIPGEERWDQWEFAVYKLYVADRSCNHLAYFKVRATGINQLRSIEAFGPKTTDMQKNRGYDKHRGIYYTSGSKSWQDHLETHIDFLRQRCEEGGEYGDVYTRIYQDALAVPVIECSSPDDLFEMIHYNRRAKRFLSPEEVESVR